MTIREEIGKCPVWKMAIIMILVVGFVFLAIEDIFVSRVFSVMDKAVTYFEKEKKADIQEMESDDKYYAEFDKKWKQGFADLAKKQEELDRKSRQYEYCRDYLQYQEQQRRLREHHVDPNNLVAKAWDDEERQRIKDAGKPRYVIDYENAIKNKEFDPATCHKGASWK